MWVSAGRRALNRNTKREGTRRPTEVSVWWYIYQAPVDVWSGVQRGVSVAVWLHYGNFFKLSKQ